MRRERLEVTAIAPGGDGVAHALRDGERRAVFVRRGVPGDTIDARVSWTTRPARAEDPRVVVASPDRREPPCPHFEECGGCATMHLRPSARAALQGRLLEETVLRALDDTSLEPVLHAAPREEGYRTRARLAIHAGRSVVVGFHEGRSRRVVPIARCLILRHPLDRLFSLLRAALSGARGEGEASVALGAHALPVVSLAWDGTLPPGTFAAFDRLVQGGEIDGVSLALEGASAPAVIGDPTVWTTGADDARLEVAPGGFAQANPEVSAALARHAMECLAASDENVVELYAGSGNLSVALASKAHTYVAVESDRAAVAAGRRNLAARALDQARFVEADASAYRIPERTNAVVLDPPRRGASAVIPAILGSRARTVVYVSCDPTTLARDAITLVRGGFHARSLHAFDMFPQTSHLESVLHLTRPPRGKSS